MAIPLPIVDLLMAMNLRVFYFLVEDLLRSYDYLDEILYIWMYMRYFTCVGLSLGCKGSNPTLCFRPSVEDGTKSKDSRLQVLLGKIKKYVDH